MNIVGLLSLILVLPAAQAFSTPKTQLPGRSRGIAYASSSSSSSGQTSRTKPRLYAYHRSRSKIVEWLLQELNVDYDVAPIAMDQKEHKSNEFLRVNPFGKLPVLEMENGAPLMESGAILSYIADKYSGITTAEERAELNAWSHFANASLGPAIFVEELRQRQMADLFTVLDKRLKTAGPFLMGRNFSMADVAVGSYLAYIPRFFPQISLSAWPDLEAYVKRLSERPAFKATVGSPPPAESS